jgi:alanyl-tRNA synthetase
MLTSLSGSQIRETFLRFFESQGHKRLGSASLVPEDPTVLLTIAGMLPFKPIFLGQREPDFPRATTSQKCIRTNDIENVGRTNRHHTFFEMLGNFSFGDYFKKEAIQWAWELVTKKYGVPPERLVVSVFEEDDEAEAIWRDVVGVSPQRIIRMGAADNFWESGPTGPCGPCSEIYYDFKPEAGDAHIDLEDDERFLEIYNLVFMEKNKDAQGNLTELPKKNIDTGMGLERMAQVLQQVDNNYETDLLFPIVREAGVLAGVEYRTATETQKRAMKVIGDHMRAVVHLIADGVTPSNLKRGYVLRRLLRRAIRYGRQLGITGSFTPVLAQIVIDGASDVYPQLLQKQNWIMQNLQLEERQFGQTLERGERLLQDVIARQRDSKIISGQDAFDLYTTYGFPVELTLEIAEEQGFTVDLAECERLIAAFNQSSSGEEFAIDLTKAAQGELTGIEKTEFIGYENLTAPAKVLALLGLPESSSLKQAEAGQEIQVILDQSPFYAESGGQVGDQGYLSGAEVLVRILDVQKQGDIFLHHARVERGILTVGDEVTAQVDSGHRRRAQAHHTATHLLQAALKKVVDENIAQAGSLVAPDRLRFDFNCPRALTEVEIHEVETTINQWIVEAHRLDIQVMPLAQAKEKGAVANFGDKYGNVVRVIDMPGVSMELCGGTHVGNTVELGLFKIVSESGVAAGIRRIEAVSGMGAFEYLAVRDQVTKTLAQELKVPVEELPQRMSALQAELRQAQKTIEQLKGQMAIFQADGLLAQVEVVNGHKVLVASLGDTDPESLKVAAERLLQKMGAGAVFLGSTPQGKVSLVANFSPEVVATGLQAGKFIGAIAKICGGGGGGRPNFAQAGGKDPEKLAEALTQAKVDLKMHLQFGNQPLKKPIDLA